MTPEQLGTIARLPFDSNLILRDAACRYEGTVIPLAGAGTVTVTRDGIVAAILNDDEWELREMAAAERAPVPLGGLFRIVAPGRLLGPADQGVITPEGRAWEGFHATYVGQRDGGDDGRATIYDFTIARLVVHGQGDPGRVGAVRHIYAGGAWNGWGIYHRHYMIVRSLSDNPRNREEETIAATFDWKLQDIHAEAAWQALNFFTGNTVKHLAEELYDDDGVLIRRVHQFGNNVSDARREFFHRFHGPPAPNAMGTLGEGFVRLMQANFPIEVVLEHLHESAGRSIDVEAQHLVLAIHTAIEAWNRSFGREQWVESRKWRRTAKSLRSSLEAQDEFRALRAELQENIRTAVTCANDTTMGWRQREFFRALGIDITEPDNARVLRLRNELLHNGHFLERWHDLAHDLQQQRHQDIERLRRLVLLIVFKLTGYVGEFMSPITYTREHVDGIDLPEAIRPPHGE
jgi:hypothetical protein